MLKLVKVFTRALDPNLSLIVVVKYISILDVTAWLPFFIINFKIFPFLILNKFLSKCI